MGAGLAVTWLSHRTGIDHDGAPGFTNHRVMCLSQDHKLVAGSRTARHQVGAGVGIYVIIIVPGRAMAKQDFHPVQVNIQRVRQRRQHLNFVAGQGFKRHA